MNALSSSSTRRSLASLLLGVALTTLLLSTPRVASADPATCSAKHEAGQSSVAGGKLRAAVEAFTACGSDDACPNLIRKECLRLFDETNRALPTVTLSATDGTRELLAVRVYADGELLVEKLEGRALPLDPGLRHFRFVLPDGRELLTDAVLREGEKNRPVGVVSSPRKASPAPEALPRARTEPSLGLGAAFWTATGVGIASVGAGVTLALLGRSEENQVAACAPRCPRERQRNLEASKDLYLGANIAFGVSIAAAVTATTLYLVTPRRASAPPPVVGTLRFDGLAVLPRPGSLQASIAFTFDDR